MVKRLVRDLLSRAKRKIAEEARLFYLIAHEKEIFPPRSRLNFFLLVLSSEWMKHCIEFRSYWRTILRILLNYANSSLALVVNGLYRIKDLQEAKKFLLRTVQLGAAH